MPDFTRTGYSGKLVEVDLQTTALGSVRLHGVVTDLADFYSDLGVGPYENQVQVNVAPHIVLPILYHIWFVHAV